MYKSSFGTNGQIAFCTPEEYYKFLGYLAKSDGTTSLHWEHNENQGAWGSEGRIHFYTNLRPFNNNILHTAGVGRVCSRVNCNEFVQDININHGFVMGDIQNANAIKSTIPVAYQIYFDMGLQL
ncbi:MAG: hypothetical protein SNI49_03395 [Rikenellaceae bacterium]